MTVYSNSVDTDVLSRLSELKRIRRGYHTTAVPWYYQCNVNNWDCLGGFPVDITRVELAKVSAKLYKKLAINTLTLAKTEALDHDHVRIAMPLSDHGHYELHAGADTVSLKYGRVYAFTATDTMKLSVKKPSSKDYYLLMIDCILV